MVVVSVVYLYLCNIKKNSLESIDSKIFLTYIILIFTNTAKLIKK